MNLLFLKKWKSYFKQEHFEISFIYQKKISQADYITLLMIRNILDILSLVKHCIQIFRNNFHEKQDKFNILKIVV